ncbi:hypothetical protein K435DRAFT_662989, partial [Dendrothele bispora CBS 962.96]
STVYKVNYLRAQARWQRWAEELILVKREMEWQVNWFENRKRSWLKRSTRGGLSRGGRAYALKEANRWGAFAERSRRYFADNADIKIENNCGRA